MPQYEFKNLESGAIIERHYSMNDAPELGTAINVDGNEYIRIISTPPMMQPVWTPYTSLSMPRKWQPEGQQLAAAGFSFDATDHVCIPTQAREREACSILERKRD